MFSRKLTLPSLIDLCRSMRYALNSGLMLRDVMDLMANKGTSQVRPVAAKVRDDLKAGWSLHDALQKQENVFPPLFVALCAVGEESGKLPEVLSELERYYVMRQKLRRDFMGQIAWPVVQFVLAVIVLTLMLWILGLIKRPDGEMAVDPLGIGVGDVAALRFFLGVNIAVWGAAALYLTLKHLLRRRAVVERFLLSVPGIGPTLRAVALSRFCISARLMLETSLSVFKTIRLAFLATDNEAFITAFPVVDASLRQGNSIATSFAKARVFPEKFLSAVAVAEESGRLPESLAFQAEEYEDETKRRMTWMTRLTSLVVMLCVFGIIIFCIVSIFRNVYLGQIEKALEGTNSSNPLRGGK
jgi:type IV pilus assembly protein PilC